MVRLTGRSQIVALCEFTSIARGPFQVRFLRLSVVCRHQGRGVMQKALEAVLPAMFAEGELHGVMAAYMPRNRRSDRLPNRLRFKREGLAREYLRIAGR